MSKTYKTTKADFEKFKESLSKYLKDYKMDFWNVGVKHIKINNEYTAARVYLDINSSVATVKFNTELGDDVIVNEDAIDIWAKHEAIHILLARITELGCSRYITTAEFDSAEEELVMRLEKLL